MRSVQPSFLPIRSVRIVLTLFVLFGVWPGRWVSPDVAEAAASSLLINFQSPTAAVPDGYLRDSGEPFGPRSGANQGSGLSYGWIVPGTSTPLNLSVGGSAGNGRDRGFSPGLDQRLDTLMHMQADDVTGSFNGTAVEGAWEIGLPNGAYSVTVAVGDALIDRPPTGLPADTNYPTHTLNVEGLRAINGFRSVGAEGSLTRFFSATVEVLVADGRLTIDANGGFHTKINYVDIVPSDTPISGFEAQATSPVAFGVASQFTAATTAGSNVSYRWQLGDGSVRTGTSFNYTYVVPGTYPVVVVASNSVDVLTRTLSVTVTPPPGPVAGLSAASSSPTPIGQATALSATISVGNDVTYVWNFGDGSALVNGQYVSHVYANEGSYTAIVTATNAGGQDTATTQVLVNNAVPQANAGSDQLVDASATVTLNGGASRDPDGHLPLGYAWSQTGGPGVTLSNPAIVNPTFRAPATPTVLTFTLVVSDSRGLVSVPDSVVVRVREAAIVGLSATSNSPTVLGLPTAFTPTLAAGTDVSYVWNFGDGSPTQNGQYVNHTYPATGTYTATVTASNVRGSSSASTRVNVIMPPLEPTGVVMRINSAGPEVTTSGVTWSADQYYDGGRIFSKTIEIANTDDDVIYQTTRSTSGSSGTKVYTYTIPVPAVGIYQVKLHFAEIFWGAPGAPTGVCPTQGCVNRRRFNVIAEQQVRLLNYDIFARAGGAAIARTETIDVAVVDGRLILIFVGTVDGPTLGGIEVFSTNRPPLANAGPDQAVEVLSTVSLDGSASSDPDLVGTLNYTWTQTGGAPVRLNAPNSLTPSFDTPEMPGIFTFTLQVSDPFGLTSSDEVVVSTLDSPISGLNAAASSPTTLGQPTAFSATIAQGLGVSYNWDFGDGTTGSGKNTTHVYAAPGIYTATLTASNTSGSQSAQVIVLVRNLAPLANAGSDQSVSVSAAVVLNGSGSSDPDGHLPLSYAWTQIAGLPVTLSSASAASPGFTAPATPAVLVFRLIVTDSRGQASPPATVTVSVGDVAPANLQVISNAPTVLGQQTNFSASALGTNVSYSWSFGDGSSATGPAATHIYAVEGIYVATVTATNGTGAQSQATVVVVVSNAAPSVSAGADRQVTFGDEVVLTANASDPDGHLPLSYTWEQIGGTPVRMSPNGNEMRFVAPTRLNTLLFRVTVADARGKSTSDTVQVTVLRGASAPNLPIFLPLMLVLNPNISQPAPVPDPADLVVSEIKLTPSAPDANDRVQVTVMVTNRGGRPTAGFWVDLYLNPTEVPTAAGQLWNKRCGLKPCYGLAWHVKGGLQPGQSIVLVSTPDSYDPAYSIWAGKLARGTTVIYAYADSWDGDDPFGAVGEENETNNLGMLRIPEVEGVTTLSSEEERPTSEQLPARP